jgi:hypothetical protein
MNQSPSLACRTARLLALSLAIVAAPSASAEWGVLYLRGLGIEAPRGEDKGTKFLKAFVKACPKGKRAGLKATQALGLNMPRSFAAFGEGVHVEDPDESFTVLGRKIHVYRRRVDGDEGPLAAIAMDGVDGYWFLLVVEAFEQALVATENPDDTSRYFLRPAQVMLEWADYVGWSMDGETQMRLRRLTISKFIAKMKAAGLTGRDSIPDGATAAFIQGIRKIKIEASWTSTDETDAAALAEKAMEVLRVAIRAAGAPLADGEGGGAGAGDGNTAGSAGAGLFGL